MEKTIKQAKTKEEALQSFFEETKLEEKDILYTAETKKGGLFKGSSVEVSIYKKEDLINYVKEYLEKLVTNLGLEVKFEVKTKEDRKIIKMYSNNNQILIGKNGQTLKALETLVRQKVNTEMGLNFKITLDVENYKDIRDKKIISLAKRTAKEVLKTKNKVVLENMTSYDRRLIHNALTDFKGIKTHSEGEEPHRHVIIEPEK